MNLLGGEHFDPCLITSVEEDLLIKKILQTHVPNDPHDPDCRYKLDAGQLLLVVERTMHFISPKFSYPPSNRIDSWNVEVFGFEEKFGYIINKISHEILCKCHEDGDIHAKTMTLFEILARFSWDAKVVLALAALVSIYGEFWLIMQLVKHNSLAALTAVLRQMPKEINALSIQFRALNLLLETMIEAANLVLEFEGLPLQQELLDDDVIVDTKSNMYMTTYWVLRSSISCASAIANFRTMKDNQVGSNSTAIAAWTLFSLVYKLSGLCNDLREKVHLCRMQIDRRFPEKLRYIFEVSHRHNQEVFRVLFSSTNDLPLKDSSGGKCGIQELKSKVVILLISKPELFAVEKIFYLVQQTCDHPLHKKLEGNYAILWVPIPSSYTWNSTDELNFQFLSNSLPWFSIRHPWLLHSAVVNFIRQEWTYKEEPLMVVLNSDGVVTNSNAIDMVWLWGAKAFPFSASREKELWEQENRILQLLIDGIDPLLTKLVEGGKYFCIYGSDDISWIREFNDTLKKIKSTGVQLDAIYVGYRNPSEDARNILDIAAEENSSISLTTTKMELFWLRLESIKNSVARLEKQVVKDNSSLQPVVTFLEACETSNSWTIIGNGSSNDVIILKGKEVLECLNLFPEWAENVEKLGVLSAIRFAMGSPMPVKPCYHAEILPSEEGLTEENAFCSRCKRPVDKFVVYQCNVTESIE